MPCIKHKVRLIQYVYYMNEQNSIQHEVKKKNLNYIQRCIYCIRIFMIYVL